MKSTSWSAVVCLGLSALMAGTAVAGEEAAPLEGVFSANGEKVELPFVYAYAQKEGFYDEADPTWTLLFVEKPLAERDLDDHIWDAAYIRLGITKTSEFGDEPEIEVLSQDIRFSAEQSGNISGGTYPELTITEAGPKRFSGRVHHPEVQEFFDDTFQFDFSFDVPLSEPFAPIGDPLPAGGGDPGAAFVAWCEAIHAGDIDRIKALMPAEQVAMLESEEGQKMFKEDLEFIQMMTPTDVEVLSGSSDGEIAILQVTGSMDGEKARGEITMTLVDGRWIRSEGSWE